MLASATEQASDLSVSHRHFQGWQMHVIQDSTPKSGVFGLDPSSQMLLVQESHLENLQCPRTADRLWDLNPGHKGPDSALLVRLNPSAPPPLYLQSRGHCNSSLLGSCECCLE